MARTAKSSARHSGSNSRQTLLILGASGDLTGRLLLPGVGGLIGSPQGKDLKLLGAGMDEWSQDQWLKRVRDCFASVHASGPRIDALLADTCYTQADVTNPDDLKGLLAQAEGPVSIFFALPPAVTRLVCEALTRIDLPRTTRLVLEKPFGNDAKTAYEMNDLLVRLVSEDNIFRVDHFLGKSTVLNLLGLRFANRIFEPVWTNEHVEKIEIIFDEDLGLEGRAGYYDKAGALKDMIQSHLLQVMAVLMMGPPPTLGAADIRDRKAEILRATHIWQDDPVTNSRRARYTPGTINDHKLPGYASSPGVDAKRKTETLAELTVEVRTWRWVGVPVVLRSGKALGTSRKECNITLRPVPLVPKGFKGTAAQERLQICMGDPASMSLGLNINGPGNPLELEHTQLEVDFGDGELKPYGEVLRGVLDHDPMLAVRGDSAVECWRIVQPVLDAWARDEVPLDTYPAGTSGPTKWHEAGGDPQA